MAIRNLATPITSSRFAPSAVWRKPVLTLVPPLALEERVKNTRIFATIMVLISAFTFAGLLTINTLLTQDAITIQKLKITSLQLIEERESINKALASKINSAALANSAKKFGMKPAEDPHFLDLSTSVNP